MARRSASMTLWDTLLVVAFCMHAGIVPRVVHSANVTCEFPAIYGFGDSLMDVGNAIAAFPNQFAYAEKNPNGVIWPMHSADRMCDGKLLIDFFSLGSSLGPTYPWLRSTATNPQWGTNFAVAGATARNQTDLWVPDSGFNTPFSLNLQLQWLQRYKVRLDLYYQQTYVNQSLPAYDTLNTSLYIVQAGFQDYFFPLYNMKSTSRTLLSNVPEVVYAIRDLLKGLADFGATRVLVVNMPPLGCFPALLTLYPASIDKYNLYGCLTNLNKISIAHNEALEQEVVALRATYTNTTFYLGDFYSVYTNILKTPQVYNITETLKACCGTGGAYNFNKDVTCSEIGTVGNQAVNLTTAPCSNSKAFLSWDGIHPSNAANRAAAAAFFAGKHITPSNFNCSANTSSWDSSF
ncbi:hypothetical protein M758_4G135000 [Ceratodon purpureus]|nr:hypothetical protein M758_4G135000 [Ceratodon purpureus]